MVRPSNPRFMAYVLDALMDLGNTRGSSAREVLNFIRQSNVSKNLKNLTSKVQRALKNAMNAGLLRHRSGRYKVLATLNPTSPSASTAKESTSNDQKNEEKKLSPDVRALVGDAKPSRRKQEHTKRTISRRRSRSRHRNTKKKSRRSPYTRRANTTVQNRKRRQRKRTYEDEELEDQSSGRYVSRGRDASFVAFDRRAKRSRVSNREHESDFSNESDRESDVNHKSVSRANTSSRREPRQKEVRAKSRGRSTSRARTPHLRRTPARQHPIEEIRSDRQQCNEEHEGIAKRSATHQEEHEATKGTCEPNDSNSGSILENS